MKIIGVFIAFCAAAVLGIASLIIGACGESGALGGKIELSELTADNIEEGLIVEGDILYVWDRFADAEKNGEVIGEYYAVVMPFSYYEDLPFFISVYSSDSDEYSTLKNMRDDFETILLGSSETDGNMLHFRGKIRKLDEGLAEMMEYSISSFVTVFELDEYTDAESLMTPYVIESYSGSDYLPFLIAGIALTIIGVGGVLILVLKDIGEGN